MIQILALVLAHALLLVSFVTIADILINTARWRSWGWWSNVIQILAQPIAFALGAVLVIYWIG